MRNTHSPRIDALRFALGLGALACLNPEASLCGQPLEASSQDHGVKVSAPSAGDVADSLAFFNFEASLRSGEAAPSRFENLDTDAGRVRDERLSSASADPEDVYWAAGFDPLGLDGEVRAFAVYQGKLIVAGKFNSAATVTAQRIAAWDGTSWSPLGSGIYGEVYALTVYEGKLIAGGQFLSAGGMTASNIVSWDGTAWSPLGSGLNARVNALAVYDGKLIAGGAFTMSGEVEINYIAACGSE
jgi:hypothetical protein